MEKSLQSPINSKYGHKSTAMEIVNGLDITGKNVVITGGYAGTGLETTKALASIGANIIVLARDTKKSKIKHEADLFKTIQQGAATAVWCAVNEDLNNIGGVYCEDCNVAKAVSADSNEPFGVRPWAIDMEAANRLWEISEKMTGIIFKTESSGKVVLPT